MNHVTSIQLCAFLDDVLVGAPDDQTARHLATCPMCRARYEAWCHVDDSLRELLGQDPDEHAMEQRTAWVEIAVTAERKGLPAPEFGELRIPLESRPAPRAAAMAPAPSHFAPPPVEQVPPALAWRTGTPTGTPTSSAPVKRPVMHVPMPTAPQAPPAPTVAPPPAPALVGAGSGQALAKAAKAGSEPASRPAPGARTPGYARLPRPPRRGLAALATRPGLWITLLVAFTLVASVVKFGIHRIQIALRESQATGDVHEAVADARTDRDPDVAPARSSDQRPRRGVPARSTAPSPSSSAGEVPEDADAPSDASILFDLPALEPEDAEPDPVVTPPNRLSPTEGREVPAPRTDDAADHDPDRPGICGEVRSTQGTPIEGARVYLASPARMVRTDRKGRFCVVCPPGPRTVRVEASGRATVKRTLQVGKRRLETRFTLDAAN